VEPVLLIYSVKASCVTKQYTVSKKLDPYNILTQLDQKFFNLNNTSEILVIYMFNIHNRTLTSEDNYVYSNVPAEVVTIATFNYASFKFILHYKQKS